MTTVFHEDRLPEDVERGAVGGPRFKTRVLPLESGYEQRNRDWEQSKGEWDISYGMMELDDPDAVETTVHDVLEFFYARAGRAYGFRFKDWSDYKVGKPATPTASGGSQLIGLGDGATTQFQAFKRYSSGGVDHDRVLTKLVAGTVSVLLDGVVQAAGVTVDVDTGLVTFAVAPTGPGSGGTGPSGEQVVSLACEFDVPVRFQSDKLDVNVEWARAGRLPAIGIEEVRPWE